ncbi:fascin domain-containing protein [Ketogulonicigenium vulgare]|uniref:fascin domain-containing protein n=1 Tax=Ketogulonicigenium vulgare TaxID=92945 RepID=UPI00235A349D|nr:hypothetical protein [Ketogulonicigenium vulgare]
MEVTMSVKIYEDDALAVFFADGGDDLVVTFSDATMSLNGTRFFGDTPLKKLGKAALGFVAKSPNWFPRDSMYPAIREADTILDKFQDITTYGGSMGGYAACKYAAAVRATRILALCPQWSIDNERCNNVYGRRHKHFNPETMQDMEVKASDLAPSAVIIYDPYHKVDRFQAGRLGSLAQDAILVPMPYVGHHVTRVVSGTIELSTLLKASKDRDRAKLISTTRGLRKNATERFESVMQKGLAKRRALTTSLMSQMALSDQSRLTENSAVLKNATAEFAKSSDTAALRAVYAQVPAEKLDERVRLLLTISALEKNPIIVTTSSGNGLTLDPLTGLIKHDHKGFRIPIMIDLRDNIIRLSAMVHGFWAPVGLRENGDLAIDQLDSGLQTQFDFSPLSTGKFSLSHNGKLCTALPNGTVNCSRSRVGAWERFDLGLSKTPLDA